MYSAHIEYEHMEGAMIRNMSSVADDCLPPAYGKPSREDAAILVGDYRRRTLSNKYLVILQSLFTCENPF